MKALKEFGFESLELDVNDFTEENMVIQLGVPPVRIDILSSISGVNFQDAYVSRVVKQFGETKANFISKEFLIMNKKTSGKKRFTRFRIVANEIKINDFPTRLYSFTKSIEKSER